MNLSTRILAQLEAFDADDVLAHVMSNFHKECSKKPPSSQVDSEKEVATRASVKLDGEI